MQKKRGKMWRVERNRIHVDKLTSAFNRQYHNERYCFAIVYHCILKILFYNFALKHIKINYEKAFSYFLFPPKKKKEKMKNRKVTSANELSSI